MPWLRSLSPVLLTAPLLAWAAPGLTQTMAQIPSYPPEVSLVSEGERGYVYRETLNNLRLYTYDLDSSDTSACTESCSSAWPPLFAPKSAKPVGQWTVISRTDGTHQWAYSGKPVYTHFHDAPDTATGDGIEGKWHLLPYTKTPS